MRILSSPSITSLLNLFLLFIASACAAGEDLRYNIGYTPLSSSSKPTSLGIILGKASSHRSPTDPEKTITKYIWSLESYTPPRKESEAWARVGLLDTAGKSFKGSSTLTSLVALTEPESHDAELYVQLDGDGLPQSIAIRKIDTPKEKGSGKNVGKPRLLVMTAAPESKAILRQPVVLNAEGKLEEPPKEKTLLQKYWWVGVVFLVINLMQGGGGEESK